MGPFVLLTRLLVGSSSLCNNIEEPLGLLSISSSSEAALFDSLEKFVCYDALGAGFQQKMVQHSSFVEAVHSGNFILRSLRVLCKKLCDCSDILLGECRIVLAFFQKLGIFEMTRIAVVAVVTLIGQSFLLHLLDDIITYQVVSDREFQQVVVSAFRNIVLFHQNTSSPYRGSRRVLGSDISGKLVKSRQTIGFPQFF